jgi:isoamylase
MKRVLVLVLLAGCGVSVGDVTEENAQTETTPSMLGAQSSSRGLTFRVRSARATRLEVWVYDAPMNGQVLKRLQLIRRAGDTWSATLSPTQIGADGVAIPLYYGYRAWGPNWPYTSAWRKGTATGFISDVDGAGNRFNPNKLLSDPYARELSHDPGTPTCLDGTLYGTGASHRTKDSGACAPKGVVLATDTTSIGTKPTRALKDDIIYEAHVQRPDDERPVASRRPCRGTYAGRGAPARP